MLECTSPAKRFPKTENCQSEQHFHNEDKNKQVHSQIKIHWKNILKLKDTKKPKYKVSKNKHTTDEDKSSQIHSQIKIHLMNVTQIGKYKTLNMTEHKTDMNITKIDKYKKSEHDGAQNRHEYY